MPLVDGAVVETPEPLLDSGTGFARDLVLAGFDRLHVHGYGSRHGDTVLAGPATHVSGVGAGHQSLGRDATGIDASSAEELPFHDGDFAAGGSEFSGKGGTCLS